MNHHNHKIGIVGCGRRMEALINNMGELRSRFPIAALCDIDRADAITGVIEVRTADGTLSDYPSGVRGSHAGGDRILLEKLLEQIEGAPCDESDIAAGLLSAGGCFALDRAMREGCVVTRSRE